MRLEDVIFADGTIEFEEKGSATTIATSTVRSADRDTSRRQAVSWLSTELPPSTLYRGGPR